MAFLESFAEVGARTEMMSAQRGLLSRFLNPSESVRLADPPVVGRPIDIAEDPGVFNRRVGPSVIDEPAAVTTNNSMIPNRLPELNLRNAVGGIIGGAAAVNIANEVAHGGSVGDGVSDLIGDGVGVINDGVGKAFGLDLTTILLIAGGVYLATR